MAYAYRQLLAGQLTGTDLPPTPVGPTVEISRPPQADELVDAVVQVYRRGIDLGRRWARPTACRWCTSGNPRCSAGNRWTLASKRSSSSSASDEFQFDAIARIFRAVDDRLPDDAVDLTEAFDDATEPILTDQAHHNELGARLVAEAMYADLAERLASEGSD